MQIPQPHININRRTFFLRKIKVRNIFRRIYQDRKINLAASRNSLEQQLKYYLEHFGKHIGNKITQKDNKRIWDIIERNNAVSKILESRNFKKLTKRQKQLLGNTALGLVFCIDGRIPAIFLGGRFARHFEIPAGELSIIKRKSDNKLIPDSSDLNEALRRIASGRYDLLEVIFAHTSLSNPHHGCGAMIAKMKAGLVEHKLSLEEANLKLIKNRTIPALSNMYKEFKVQLGLEPLKTIAIAALYDTDTFGIILNIDLRKEGKALSTTELTSKFKAEMDLYFIKDNLMFGSFKEKFSDLAYLTPFSKNMLEVTESLLDKKVVPLLVMEVKNYLDKFYQDLTDRQKQALLFLIIRNIAFQYLTGLSNLKRKIADHPFFEHEETYMAVAMRGATIGKFDPENQAFAATPADPKQAIANINSMLSLMGNSKKPYILFVCNSINSRDIKENGHVLQRLLGSNAGLLRDIINDHKLGAMIESGEIIPVPLLIEETTREVLKIVDHSGYI